jgi:crossover junction endodeoxyribonuclease RusA
MSAGKRKDSLTIELPLPPRELSPNWRGHWARKSKATKALRKEAAWLASLEQGGELGGGFDRREWKSAVVLLKFYFKDKRRRDRDNLLASCKAIFDGLADAGVVDNDAAFGYLPVLTGVDKANPRVVVTVTEDRQ